MRDAATDLARHTRRFFRGLRGSLSPAEERAVHQLLGPAELRLFASLQGRERRHALDVLTWLRANASPSDELLLAALLHNTGKGALHAHERILHVLLLQFAPRTARSASLIAAAAGWDTPSRRCATTPSAEQLRLAAIGCSPRVCELVRRHHDASPGDDRELAWLMEADQVC